MRTGSTAAGRRSVLAAAASAVVLATGGTAAVVAGLSAPPSGVSARAPDVPLPSAAANASPRVTAPRQPEHVLSRSRPVTLTIASIGVDHSPLVELGKEPDGALEVPSDPDRAGWFEPGPAPGQFGPAVLAGHVDSKVGPAVFYRLHALAPGAVVDVARADGRVARFAVDRVERYAKDHFPTRAVYGDTRTLPSCG